MNIKKINKKLSKIRDNVLDTDHISEEDKADLLSLVQEAIMQSKADEQNKLPKDISPYLPIADNDNKVLTTEQKFRLRLIEKTGTGSSYVH